MDGDNCTLSSDVRFSRMALQERQLMIEIVEPHDGSQKEHDGKLFIACDCEFLDRCPQGKQMGSDRCIIRLNEVRLNENEQQRLKESQR